MLTNAGKQGNVLVTDMIKRNKSSSYMRKMEIHGHYKLVTEEFVCYNSWLRIFETSISLRPQRHVHSPIEATQTYKTGQLLHYYFQGRRKYYKSKVVLQRQ